MTNNIKPLFSEIQIGYLIKIDELTCFVIHDSVSDGGVFNIPKGDRYFVATIADISEGVMHLTFKGDLLYVTEKEYNDFAQVSILNSDPFFLNSHRTETPFPDTLTKH